MVDENAFGILLSFHGIEDEEYRVTPEQFAHSFTTFRAIVQAWAQEVAWPPLTRALFLGHALYLEWPDPEDRSESSEPAAEPFNPIASLREVRRLLSEQELASVVVLSFGARWVPAFDQAKCEWTQMGKLECLDFGQPSEALRRALYADTLAQPSDTRTSWGPGLYLDTEAVAALGKRPQNQPTVLEAAQATFYRAGS